MVVVVEVVPIVVMVVVLVVLVLVIVLVIMVVVTMMVVKVAVVVVTLLYFGCGSESEIVATEKKRCLVCARQKLRHDRKFTHTQVTKLMIPRGLQVNQNYKVNATS